MFTIESVVGRVLDLSAIPKAAGWPAGCTPGLSLPLAGGGRILLPIDPMGLDLGAIDEESAALFGDSAVAARAATLTQGSFATPLQLEADSNQRVLPGRGKIRHVLNAARLLGGQGTSIYGLGTFIHTEAALRPGSSSLTYVSHQWFTDLDDFAVALTGHLVKATSSVLPRHEASAYPWSRATLLLSGPAPRGHETLVRQLKFAAGLFEVVLQVEFNADSRHQELSRGIRTRPPNQLLIRDHVVSGSKFIETFVRANPNGYSDWLQSPSSSDVEALVRELVCHFALMRETDHFNAAPVNWSVAEAAIRELATGTPPVIVLTDRASKMLIANPYPDPGRMVAHFRLLVDLARKYHDGVLGGRLEDAAAAIGLTVALFDGGLNPSKLVLDGVVTNLKAEPHVKVDDHVSPDRCGRIYFALDPVGGRFVVDHIGIHNYS